MKSTRKSAPETAGKTGEGDDPQGPVPVVPEPSTPALVEVPVLICPHCNLKWPQDRAIEWSNHIRGAMAKTAAPAPTTTPVNGGVDPLQEILAGAGSRGYLQVLETVLRGQADPRDMQIMELQRQLTEMKMANEFAKLRAEFQEKAGPSVQSAPVAAKSNGSPLDDVLGKVLLALVERGLTPPPPPPDPLEVAKKGLEGVKAFTDMAKPDLDAMRLQLAMDRWKIEREDRFSAAAAEHAHNDRLVGLMQDAFRQTLAPIVDAGAKGLEQFAYMRAAYPQGVPPEVAQQLLARPSSTPVARTQGDYLQMSDEQLARESMKVGEARRVVQEHESMSNQVIQGRRAVREGQPTPAAPVGFPQPPVPPPVTPQNPGGT